MKFLALMAKKAECHFCNKEWNALNVGVECRTPRTVIYTIFSRNRNFCPLKFSIQPSICQCDKYCRCTNSQKTSTKITVTIFYDKNTMDIHFMRWKFLIPTKGWDTQTNETARYATNKFYLGFKYLWSSWTKSLYFRSLLYIRIENNFHIILKKY